MPPPSRPSSRGRASVRWRWPPATSSTTGASCWWRRAPGPARPSPISCPRSSAGSGSLISTGTRNLQDQIFYKDLPALRDALDVDFTATYMKGRGNYLCLHRFEARLEDDASEPQLLGERSSLDAIREWAETTETGDRAEIEDLPDDLPLWHDISASSENCVGTDCPRFDDCYVTRMRRQAMESDLVIVNHHLLCADASVRQSAYGEVVPSCRDVIVDEAHQLEDVATQYFGVVVSSYRVDELARDTHQAMGAGTDSPLGVRGATPGGRGRRPGPAVLRRAESAGSRGEPPRRHGRVPGGGRTGRRRAARCPLRSAARAGPATRGLRGHTIAGSARGGDPRSADLPAGGRRRGPSSTSSRSGDAACSCGRRRSTSRRSSANTCWTGIRAPCSRPPR